MTPLVSDDYNNNLSPHDEDEFVTVTSDVHTGEVVFVSHVGDSLWFKSPEQFGKFIHFLQEHHGRAWAQRKAQS